MVCRGHYGNVPSVAQFLSLISQRRSEPQIVGCYWLSDTLMLTDIQAIFTNEWSFHKSSSSPSPSPYL